MYRIKSIIDTLTIKTYLRLPKLCIYFIISKFFTNFDYKIRFYNKECLMLITYLMKQEIHNNNHYEMHRQNGKIMIEEIQELINPKNTI